MVYLIPTSVNYSGVVVTYLVALHSFALPARSVSSPHFDSSSFHRTPLNFSHSDTFSDCITHRHKTLPRTQMVLCSLFCSLFCTISESVTMPRVFTTSISSYAVYGRPTSLYTSFFNRECYMPTSNFIIIAFVFVCPNRADLEVGNASPFKFSEVGLHTAV
ncbi:hypothetical protein BC629DRAFT_198872 [Irpex lacteus]|nr:hypothetical protein BC629DRAFT_198872 [Irpex lacteus]